MGRLIDAEELKERFCEENCGKNRCVDHMDKCAWILSVEESKTAFDVDKVVERLEEEKKRAFKLCLGTNDSTQRLKYIEKEQTIALAIEIVKGGGVNGN